MAQLTREEMIKLGVSTRFNKENAKEKGAKGGFNSGKSKREKKALREVALKILNSSVRPEMIEKLKQFNLLSVKDITYNAAVVAKQLEQALKGNVNSARFLMEASDQKPTDKQELTAETTNRQEVVIAKDQLTADVYNQIMNGGEKTDDAAGVGGNI